MFAPSDVIWSAKVQRRSMSLVPVHTDATSGMPFGVGQWNRGAPIDDSIPLRDACGLISAPVARISDMRNSNGVLTFWPAEAANCGEVISVRRTTAI